MMNVRVRLAFLGETVVPQRVPSFESSPGISGFSTSLPVHGPEELGS